MRNGINIEHACEKACACTTCHVIVKEGFSSLKEASDEEEDLLDKVIDAISKAANTGKVGDGKIFITTLEEVVRIRTGETGPEAV